MGKRVGIDLGSSYTKIAFIDNNGDVVGVPNMEGSYSTPSGIFFDENDEVVIGQEAKDLSIINPCNYISDIKSLISNEDCKLVFNNHIWSKKNIITTFIKRVLNDAENSLYDIIDEVTIAVPSYYTRDKCYMLKRVVEAAGFKLSNVLTEPAATALAYGVNSKKHNRTVLIYDLGGRTFDASVVRIENETIKIIYADRDSSLGGNDWDTALLELFYEEFRLETGFDGELGDLVRQHFRLKAEKTKMALSLHDEASVILDAGIYNTRIRITKNSFEEITRYLLDKTIEKTDITIASAESEGYQIDEILLVGGSTRMTQVRETLYNRYAILPRLFDPGLAIAKGAAIYGSLYY